MVKKFVLLFLFSGLSYASHAQAVTNAPAYKNIANDGYYRLCYENDFFAATDRYYTQGVDMELVSPAFKKLITNKILLTPRFNYMRYGVGVQHNGYTPSSLGSDKVLYGNRPFAGVLMAKTFVTAIDTIEKQRFTTTVSGGVIGSSALAGEMQKFIHKGLANIMPRGWENQIHNDLALNYTIAYEKQLLGINRYFSVSGAGTVNIGTLNCGAGFGSTIMAGYFLSPYNNRRMGRRDFQLYFYDYPEIYIPGYDATLQGGMFNHTTPYVIRETDITRPVRRNRMGLVLAYQGIYLEYFATTVSKEFATALNHAYGGVEIAVAF